jgi:hypothetical protein
MGKHRRFLVIASREVTFGALGRSIRMMINRRDFVAGAALVFVGPTVGLLPPQQPSSSKNQSGVVFMIRGWSVQDDRVSAHQVWLTVSNSWRAAWR